MGSGWGWTSFFKLFIYLFIHLFLTVLDLRCYMGFSLVAASGGYSLVGVRRHLISLASLVEHGLWAHRLQWLWHVGWVALHVESSWNRDQTLVSCIGRQTFYHWTTREIQGWTFVNHIFPQHVALKGFSWDPFLDKSPVWTPQSQVLLLWGLTMTLSSPCCLYKSVVFTVMGQSRWLNS